MPSHKIYDFSVNDISQIYAGSGGKIWELLMGEQIHVGGAEQTDVLFKKLGIAPNSTTYLLDICSALGGPARYLVQKYGIKVVGLDITPEMIEEARNRTKGELFTDKIEYRLGSALDIPAHASTFDIVWGQDAWCYVRDKKRLVEEAARVLKYGGVLGFTDWIWGNRRVSTEAESDLLMKFMAFPNMQTLEGYVKLIKVAGLKLVQKMYLGEDFSEHMDIYNGIVQGKKQYLISNFGKTLYTEVEAGLLAWQKAAHEGKVGRGLWIAKKL